MKISIFYLKDLQIFPCAQLLDPWPLDWCFAGPVVLGLVGVFLRGGGPHFPSWAGRQSPLCPATWAFSWMLILPWRVCFAEMHLTKALCRHQLVLQEPGGVRGWKSMRLFPGPGGVSLERFLFLIPCPVKQGYLTPACHSTKTHLTVHSLQLGQFQEFINACGTRVRDSSGSIFQNQT